MRLARKDIVATCAVVVAVALYVVWVAGATLPGMEKIRVTASAVLVLGFVASAVAVVPGFEELIHGSKAYLAAMSALGLVALAAGVVTLWSASEPALTVLVVTLVALWLVATVHHAVLASAGRDPRRHVAGQPR